MPIRNEKMCINIHLMIILALFLVSPVNVV